jgi:Domain of unknown function (DUF4277)
MKPPYVFVYLEEVTSNHYIQGEGMSGIPPEIEVYQIHHLPIMQAYADKIGLVEVITQLMPTEMKVDPGPVVLGMMLDTLSGRSPLYCLAEFFTHDDTALLLGRDLPPQVFNDDNVGRVLDRLYATVFQSC